MLDGSVLDGGRVGVVELGGGVVEDGGGVVDDGGCSYGSQSGRVKSAPVLPEPP